MGGRIFAYRPKLRTHPVHTRDVHVQNVIKYIADSL